MKTVLKAHFTVFPEAACGDLDETHTNYAEEKTQK